MLIALKQFMPVVAAHLQIKHCSCDVKVTSYLVIVTSLETILVTYALYRFHSLHCDPRRLVA